MPLAAALAVHWILRPLVLFFDIYKSETGNYVYSGLVVHTSDEKCPSGIKPLRWF